MLASAILCVSSLFLTALPLFCAASSNSNANRSTIVLSPRLRALIARVYWTDTRLEDLAEEQGVPLDTLRKARFRAMEVLRRELEGSPAERMRRLRSGRR